jgi:hypothetical protein
MFEMTDREALEEYEKACALARAEFEKTYDPAVAAYAKVRAEHKKVRAAEYDKSNDPAWAAYDKVRGPAEGEYEKACALAWTAYKLSIKGPKKEKLYP